MPAVCKRVEGESSGRVREALREFLEAFPEARVVESGEVIFDLREASYELREEFGRVMLHLWSAERSVVRRVTGVARQGTVLRLEVLRLGQRMPARMELVAGRVAEHQRVLPATRDRERERYRITLSRVLEREFPEFTVECARSTMDLQHSFGPAVVRGLQVRGQSAWAFVGVGEHETDAAVEGVLTVGLLWLAHSRERAGARRVVVGLRLVVPEGEASLTQARLAWLDPRIASYELYELQRSGELRRCDPADRGNLRTKLLRAPDEDAALAQEGRFATVLPAALALLPELPEGVGRWAWGPALREQLRRAGVEARLRSGAELALLRHGLEFCRMRLSFPGGSFNRMPEVVVGAGAHETTLTPENAGELRLLVGELFLRRRARAEGARSGGTGETAPANDVLFRMQPERWLESKLRAGIGVLDETLRAEPVYVQIGAVAGAGDRGMIDLLACTRSGRLAVVEVKADEDLQLPLQGLDYWIRVRDHQRANLDPTTGRGDLQQQGYFAEKRLKTEEPLLFLVAPALHIHPSTEVILRFLHPSVEWRLVALDERWRVQPRPIWRRQAGERGTVTLHLAAETPVAMENSTGWCSRR